MTARAIAKARAGKGPAKIGLVFLPLNEPRPELFYAQGPVGYIDYPRL